MLPSLSPWISNNITVRMGSDFAVLPDNPLPAGFSLRNYLPGDKRTWIQLQRAAGCTDEISEETFLAEFGCHQPSLASRQFFALAPGGKPAGTATAWFAGRACGLIKGLAVALDYLGCGLEEALVSEACRRFRGLGYTRCSIEIGSDQIGLIRWLNGVGFCPEISSARDQAVWADLQALMHKPARQPLLVQLSGWVKSALGGGNSGSPQAEEWLSPDRAGE